MPPFVRRKRSHTPDQDEPVSSATKRVKHTPKVKAASLFDAVDITSSHDKGSNKSRRVLDELAKNDSSSESDADTDDFEDVLSTSHAVNTAGNTEDEQNIGDDDMTWENAIQDRAGGHEHHAEIGDVSISMREDGSYVEPLVSAATGKKGPSKRERQIRMMTHCLHVQTLMWHNTVRNSWLNDSTVQKYLLDALPSGIQVEVTGWKKHMGMLTAEELRKEKERLILAKRMKLKNKKKDRKNNIKGRDWSYSADHNEVGSNDLSHGDPMLRLLKMLAAYWRKRFTITAPGLRKIGYMSLRRLQDDIKSWERDHHAEDHGERIETLQAFRKLAKECEGSRDVGAQLFVALLRGIGLQVRMVASLQPAGFGWSKNEDANAVKKASDKDGLVASKASAKAKQLPPPKLREALTPKQGKRHLQQEKPSRQSARGNRLQPINLDDSDSPLSSPPSETAGEAIEIDSSDDNDSVVDVTPISKKRPIKKYDRELAVPVYWAEVLSPVNQMWIPVDAVVLSTVANNEELLQSFEPRGVKADKAKQVLCYIVAHDADGTAKDVTIRYLKRHQLPGKTKGMRMPVEKVPIYNKRGKIKKHEEYDWFGELMLYFRKREKDRNEADDLEESTVLKPFKPEKEKKIIENESLAWYKSSAEFVLEDHLRREEALLPEAKPVKMFSAGKGEKAKDYPVFLRKDVVLCKTVESWHKEGRGLIPGAQPLKYVPIRAVTLQRKREIEDAERETGEKLKQGLYSESQTDWIIPPPIVNGVIPKNAFNNMDVFVPTMVPAGAVHLPLRGSVKICKRLEIDYAEACTGFEFGKQRAVPVITGVVVARENANLVRNAWKIDQAEIKRKEDVKRTAAALSYWRKMLVGLRVLDKMRVEYANSSKEVDANNPFVRKSVAPKVTETTQEREPSDGGGGFFLHDDENEADLDRRQADSGYLTAQHDDLGGGGFMVDEGDELNAMSPNVSAAAAPISLQSMHGVAKDDSPDLEASEDDVHMDGVSAAPDSIARTGNRLTNIGLERQQDQHEKLQGDNTIRSSESAKLASLKGKAQRPIKSTPRKSPYFSSQELVESGDDSDNTSDSSKPEVISVRRTTARTRRNV